MSVDPHIKFSRTRKGYSPREVDEAFDDMQQEIDALKQLNSCLLDNIKQYDEKLQLLYEGMKRLEDARNEEKLRREEDREEPEHEEEREEKDGEDGE